MMVRDEWGDFPNEGGTTGPPSFMSFLDMSGGGFFV